VPEDVRLGRKGPPFAPDYHLRVRSEIGTVLDRLQSYRANGADEFLNLSWLEQAATDVRGGGAPRDQAAIRIQHTAMAADFCLWWNGSRRQD
jgi:hypothetical protein